MITTVLMNIVGISIKLEITRESVTSPVTYPYTLKRFTLAACHRLGGIST